MNAATRVAVVLSSLLAASAWADHPRPPSGHAYPGVPQPSPAQRVDARLAKAQAALQGAFHHSGEKKHAMRAALDEILAARAELAASGPYVPTAPPPPSMPSHPRAMRDEILNLLVAALDREKNPEDQLLTAAQARRLLESFSSGRDRLDALHAMKRRMVDPRNAEVIAQAFWSSNDQREARRMLDC